MENRQGCFTRDTDSHPLSLWKIKSCHKILQLNNKWKWQVWAHLLRPPTLFWKQQLVLFHPRPIDHQCLSASKSLSPIAITVQISEIANRVIHSRKKCINPIEEARSLSWKSFRISLRVVDVANAIRTSQKECFRGNDPTKCNTKLFRQEILKGTYNCKRK
jgi:hypothetical protein